jgi:hypothetical protein
LSAASFACCVYAFHDQQIKVGENAGTHHRAHVLLEQNRAPTGHIRGEMTKAEHAVSARPHA